MLSEPEKIRVMFSKTGSLKFISHLDLNRTVKSAFLRSKLPIWYTQGFNPHPKTVFSLPLSVGTSSLTEFMDFRITEEVSGEEICKRLNEVFPTGLRAISAAAPVHKFSDIGWADYEICFETADAAALAEKIKEALSGPIVVEKTTKIGTRTVDMAPYTKLVSSEPAEGGLKMKLCLSAAGDTYVNPRYIIDFLTEKTGYPSEDDDYTVCRTAAYLADGKTLFS